MPTLEEILNQRIQEGTNVSSDTQSNVSNLSEFGTSMTQLPENNLVENWYLGKNLWDFGREAVQSGVDSFLFGIPSAVTGWDPGEGADTEVEKWGRDVGAALGFLGPFGAGKVVVGGGARTLARAGSSNSKVVAKAIEKGIRKDILSAGTGVAVREGVEAGTKKIIDKVGLEKSFMKDVIEPNITKPIKGFDDYFGNAQARNNLLNQTDDEAMAMLKEYAKKSGYEVSDDAAKGINNIVKKALDEAGGRPISNMSGLVSKYLGRATGNMDSKAATFYSHLFEEAMVFAVVENAIHGIDLWAERTDEWDPLGTTMHAVALGHILGGVRFIPGGIKGGVLSIMRGDAKKRVDILLGGQKSTGWFRGYRTWNESGRDAIRAQYNLFGQIKDTPMGGAPVNELLEQQAKKFVKKKGWENKLDTTDLYHDGLEKAYLGATTNKEKRMIAKIMQDGNKYLQGEARKYWRKKIGITLAKDLAGSAPRMFVGGLAMSGGPQVLMSPDLTLQDKARALLIGAFLMKHGKELTYRDFNTKRYEMYEPFGRAPMKSFPDRMLQAEEWVQALGGKFNEANKPLWRKITSQIAKENQREMDTLLDNVEISNPKAIESLIEILGTKNEKQPLKKDSKGNEIKGSNAVFVTDRTAEVKNVKPKGRQVADTLSAVRQWAEIYQKWQQNLSSDFILGDGKRIKNWSELTAAEQRLFVDKMKKMNIKRGERGINKLTDMWHDANIAIFVDAHRTMARGVERVANALEIVDMPLVEYLDGRMQFREIDYGNVINKLTEVQKSQISQYNSVIGTLNRLGIHKLGKERVVLTERNMPNEGKMSEFVEQMVDLRTEVNNKFGINAEQHFKFSDGWFKNALDYTFTYESVKNSMELLPAFLRDNPTLARLLRLDMGSNYATEIKVIGGSKELQMQITELLKMARKTDTGAFTTAMVKGEVEISAAKAKELLQKLEENGIGIFRNVRDWDFNKVMAMANRRIKDKMLDEGTVYDPKTKKWQELTEEDLAQISLLEANGFIAKDSLTIAPYVREFFEIHNVITEYEIEMEGKKSADRTVEGMLEWLESTGKNPQTVENIKAILTEIGNREGLATTPKQQIDAFLGIKKSFEAHINKFIKQGDGKGVLNVDIDGPRSVLKVSDIVALEMKLTAIATGQQPIQARNFIDNLFNSIKEREMGVEEAKTKRMLFNLALSRAGNRDAIDVMALATEYGLYNHNSGQFNHNLKPSEYEALRQALKDKVQKRWDEPDKTIDDIYDRLLREEGSEAGDYNTADINQIINTVKFDGIFADNTKLTGKTRLQEMQDIWTNEVEYTFRDGTKQILRPGSDIDFINAFADNMIKNNGDRKNIDVEVVEASQTMLEFISGKKSSVKIKRMRFNEARPDDTVHYQDEVKLSDVMEIVEGVQISGSEIVILDYEGMGLKGSMSNRGNASFLQKARKNLARGTYVSMDRKFQIFASPKSENTPYIQYQYADNKYAYLIEATPQNLKVISDNYVRFLQERVNDGYISPDKMKNILEKEAGFVYNEKNQRWEKDWSSQDAYSNELIMHNIMNDFTMGTTFRKRWWSHHTTDSLGNIDFAVGDKAPLREAKNLTFNKLMKRARLFDNISAKRFTKQDILQRAEALQASVFADTPNLSKVIRQLTDFANGRVHEIVIRDEGGLNTETIADKNTEIDKLFSVMKTDIDRLEAIMNNKNIDQKTRDIAENQLNDLKALIRDGKIGDASAVNGITFVDANWFQTFSMLAGNWNYAEVGGIKPIILGHADGRIFVNKTAFARDSKVQKFFDNNPDVPMVTFTSAAKDVGGGYERPIMEASEWNLSTTTPVPNQYKNVINPENLRMISTKDLKKKATISLNHTVHMRDKTEMDAFVDYFYRDDFTDMKTMAEKFKNASNWEEATAIFKMWTMKKAKESDGIDKSYEQIGVQQMLAENNVHPGLMPVMMENMFKTNLIDPQLKKQLNSGGQGVLTPDINIGKNGEIIAGGSLINTLVVGDKIWDYGQAEIPYYQRNAEVDLDNITLVKRRKNDYDELIPFKKAAGSNILRDALDRLRGKYKNLGAVHEWASRNGYEVLLATERAPVTKPSSVMVIGLKGFASPVDGPIFRLNGTDVKRVAEGDFDIDTANYYWNMPHIVAESYARNRATVQDSRAIELDNSANWRNTDIRQIDSVHRFNDSRRKADIMRGTVMNSQRILQKIIMNEDGSRSQYKIAETREIDGKTEEILSAENYNKFLLQLDQNRYLIVRKDTDVTLQRIADLNQHILDAANGYNTSLFESSAKLTQDIFFDKTHGLFQVAKLVKRKSKFGVEESFLVKQEEAGLSETEMKTLNDRIITPYRDLLRLSNKIYDKGVANRVGFRDLVTGVTEFNTSMYGAAKLMKKDLGLDRAKDRFDFLGDWAIGQRIGTGRTGDAFHSNVNVYDRLLAEVVHVKNLGMDRTQFDFNETSIIHGKEINKLLFETPSGEKTIDSLDWLSKNYIKKTQIANSLERRIRNLKKLRNKLEGAKWVQERIDLMEKRKKGLLNSIKSVDKELIKDMTERVLEEKKREFYKKNKKNMEEEQIKLAKKSIEQDILKNGVPKIETYVAEDLLHAIAMVDAFGGYAYKNAQELGYDRSFYTDMSRDARDIKKWFGQAWSDFRNNKESVIDYRDGSRDKIIWVNADHIYQHFLSLMQRKMETYASVQERNIFLAKIMTPTVDMSKLVEYRGKFFPKPVEKRIDKYVNLGLRYNVLYQPQLMANRFAKDIGKAYGNAHLTLVGERVPGARNNREIDGDFYFDPFTHTEAHSKSQLLFALNPKAAEYSRLSQFEKYQKLFGTGMIRDHMNQYKFTELPHDVMSRVGLYGRNTSLGTMNDLQKSFDEQGVVYLMTEGQNSVFDFNQNLNNMNPYGSGSKPSKPSDYVKRQNKQSNKWCD